MPRAQSVETGLCHDVTTGAVGLQRGEGKQRDRCERGDGMKGPNTAVGRCKTRMRTSFVPLWVAFVRKHTSKII